MKTILATAYAVNPSKGSEDGMGWNFIYQIARFNKVIAVTRENNQPAIELYMDKNPDAVYQNITFLYFDLPYWMLFWKKGERGAMLYFYLWQRFLPNFIKIQNLTFDIVHNVNFHNDWTPSFLWKLNKPFVWGPIGHHPCLPKQYLRSYKKSYLFKNYLTYLVKLLFWNFSFSLQQTKNKAAYIFCMNKQVPLTLKLKDKQHSIIPSVATQDFGFNVEEKAPKFTFISAGRLVPLKGFDLTIKAFANFLRQQPELPVANCELVIVGSGPERDYYKALVKKENIENYVHFISWIDRQDLMTLFKNSSAFVFPSHEGAGMVVAEALSFGLPVLCLDNCGPGEFINESCGIAVSYRNYDQTVKELSAAMDKLFNSPLLTKQMSYNARKHFENHFHWDVRGEAFRKVYQSI